MSQEQRIFSRKEDRMPAKLRISQFKLSFNQNQRHDLKSILIMNMSLWMPRIKAEPQNPIRLFRQPSLSIFVRAFCCQAGMLCWNCSDKLHPALTAETAQVSSACKSLGAVLPLKAGGDGCGGVQGGGLPAVTFPAGREIG